MRALIEVEVGLDWSRSEAGGFLYTLGSNGGPFVIFVDPPGVDVDIILGGMNPRYVATYPPDTVVTATAYTDDTHSVPVAPQTWFVNSVPQCNFDCTASQVVAMDAAKTLEYAIFD